MDEEGIQTRMRFVLLTNVSDFENYELDDEEKYELTELLQQDCNLLVSVLDNKLYEVIAADNGEPEDNTFTRDYSFVPFILNAQQGKIEELAQALGLYQQQHNAAVQEAYQKGFEDGKENP